MGGGQGREARRALNLCRGNDHRRLTFGTLFWQKSLGIWGASNKLKYFPKFACSRSMDCHCRCMRTAARKTARKFLVYVTTQLSMLRALFHNSLQIVPQVSCALAEGSADGLDGTDEQFQIITIACRPWGIATMWAARREGKPQMNSRSDICSPQQHGEGVIFRRMEAGGSAARGKRQEVSAWSKRRLGWV